MRTKGHKCYNIKCGACVGKTLCGLSGDEALTCVDRMVNQKTNADRIRAMSDEELAEFMCDNDNSWVTSMGRQLRYDNYLEWLQQPVKEDA
jgi:hypothetical protein